jgi:hypothetical protein
VFYDLFQFSLRQMPMEEQWICAALFVFVIKHSVYPSTQWRTAARIFNKCCFTYAGVTSGAYLNQTAKAKEPRGREGVYIEQRPLTASFSACSFYCLYSWMYSTREGINPERLVVGTPPHNTCLCFNNNYRCLQKCHFDILLATL